MRWIILPLLRYFDFSGRSRRKEFWLFQLIPLAVFAAFAGRIFATLVEIGRQGDTGHVVSDVADVLGRAIALLGIFALATLIPQIAVQVRRFHDQNLSGWLVLLNLIPAIGSLIVLVMMCVEGTSGPNRFGPDPKAEDDW